MWLRSLLPLRRITVDTGWPVAEVEREIGRMLRPRDGTDASDGGSASAAPAWRGTCSGGAFRIVRRTRHTVLVAAGRVRATERGAEVALTLRWPIWMMAMVLGGVPAVVFLCIAVTLAAIVRGEGIVPLVLVVPLGLLPGLIRPFWQEAHEVEASLRRQLPPPPPAATGPFR
ncbi:MAG TPA: hypothetical protein VE987_18210 [Polyangiaceae bacterium]|nr:hypothetical protein [Polyangiaceae bacterium]